MSAGYGNEEKLRSVRQSDKIEGSVALMILSKKTKMNKIDEYWVWCTKAIANPNISNDRYYYDASLDRLFALRYNGNDISPLFRNPWWTAIVEKRQLFQEEIFNLKKDNSSVLELPRLSFEIKKDFLSKFISNIDNEFSALKMALLEELSSFTQQSEFGFKTNIKSYWRVFGEYDKERYFFLGDTSTKNV